MSKLPYTTQTYVTRLVNISGLVKSIINKALEIEVPLVVYIDSKSLYEYLIKLGTI